ncbi:MAG TPA: UbiX family flavin prenyltransferase [Pseudonocardia sp.]|jgi:4-hydroxy-3-polyprenylbenzoate decarboxylase|nr:UbiX family flavin prenyltransferase [Pseudonocardia sp.]
MSADHTRRLIVAVTGASGAPYAVHILKLLHSSPGYEAHLVISSAGAVTLRHETRLKPNDLSALAAVTYRNSDIGAAIASGSFPTGGMIVAPCSIRTLAAVANCDNSTLIARAADVCLKEGRPLLLMVRETPLHKGHLRLMAEAADAGAIIAPPVPAFYAQPRTIADLVDHTARRMLQRLGVSTLAPEPWSGLRNNGATCTPDGGPQLLHGRRKEGSDEPGRS